MLNLAFMTGVHYQHFIKSGYNIWVYRYFLLCMCVSNISGIWNVVFNLSGIGAEKPSSQTRSYATNIQIIYQCIFNF